MSDSPVTHPWLDLSPYHLMAQLAVDGRGNKALMLRPFDVYEEPDTSKKRAALLDERFSKITEQVGQDRLVARVLRSQINLMTGQMIQSPAQMHAFLKKVFPKANAMNLTFEQMRQHESIRQAASAMKAAQRVTKDSPLNLDSLNQAFPGTGVYDSTEGALTFQLGKTKRTTELSGAPTNGDAEVMVQGILNALLATRKTDDLERLQTRMGTLKTLIDSPESDFWASTIASFEMDILNQWKIEAIQARKDLESQTDKTEGAQNNLDGQGGTDDQAAGGEGPPVWDNVQQEGREIGLNLAGDTLYEDKRGVRFRIEGNIAIKEKVLVSPTREGVAPEVNTADRGMEFSTVSEALAAPHSGLNMAQKIRAMFEHTMNSENPRQWLPMQITHKGIATEFLARSAVEPYSAGDLELAFLRIPLSDGTPEIQLERGSLSRNNRIDRESVWSPADEQILKIWTELGLSLPDDLSGTRFDAPGSDKVNPENLNQESHDDRDNESAISGADRVGGDHASGNDAATNAGGSSEPVPAGGRSGGNDDGADGAKRGSGATVSDPVEHGEQPGDDPAGAGKRHLLGGDPESGDGSTGELDGENLDAELAPRGPSSGGRGVGDGRKSDSGDVSDDSEDKEGFTATNRGDSGLSGTSGEGDSEGATAVQPPSIGGDPGNSGIEPSLPDESAGESGEPEGSSGRPVSSASGTDRGGSGSRVSDSQGQTDQETITPAGGHGAQGEDPDNSATGHDGGGTDGDGDWGSFADEQSAQSPGSFEPLHGNTQFEQRPPTQRLRDNLSAIQRLHELETDGGTPTLEDREVMAGYSGFGGIHPQMFRTYGAPDFIRDATITLGQMVKDKKLSSKEYSSLQSTVLNAHYTHHGIIEPAWEALAEMGVPMDRVLEPSAGILNFKAFMPESVRSKIGRITAVEIDPLTARLAQAAHPDATVVNSGLEKTNFPDDFFDVAISNIPFGDYGVFDPENPQRKASIHNYFFQKALDKVRPGGVVAFVTSSYVLDGTDTSVREEIMDKSHVMGTFRLPNDSFKKTTGTEVVTDLIFLQKKGNFTPNYQPMDILDTTTIEAPLATNRAVDVMGKVYEPGDLVPGNKINSVYTKHPENILGDVAVTTNQFGPAMQVFGGGDVANQKATLKTAIGRLPKNVTDATRVTLTAQDIEQANQARLEKTKDLSMLPGALSIVDGNIHKVSISKTGELVQSIDTDIPKPAIKRMKAATEVLLSLSDLLEAESSGEVSDEDLDERRESTRELMSGWEAIEKNTKAPFPVKAWKILLADPRAQRIQIQELYDPDARTITQPDIAFGRTIRQASERPTTAPDVETALTISLAYTGRISENYMANLLAESDQKVTPESVRQALIDKNLAFVDPKTNDLIERAVYLSGNLKPKIDTVRAIVESAPEFARNLEALEASLPPPLTPSQIKLSVDAFWIPDDIMNQFLSESLGLETEGHKGVRAYFDDVQRHWRLEPSATTSKPSLASCAVAQEHVTMSRFGTPRHSALDILANAYTSTIPKVMDPIPGTEPRRYQINAQETLKAQAKFDEVTDAFSRWIFKDGMRAQRLCDIYNERFNTTVLYDPDGSHLVFPGMAEKWVPRKHQSDFIWRAVSGKNSMTAHVVGAGKTLQLIGTAVRGKQMGRWSKGMVVVPNHMLEQLSNDGQDIYPNAKILMMTAADARASNRAAFAAKCAMGDWDLIVCTHSVFEKITVPQEFEVKIIDRELNKLRNAMEDENSNSKPKEVEAAIKRLESQLERTMKNINKGEENVLNMREIGIDFIGIDEAHYYKNLMVDTAKQIPGVSNASSKRAMNMLIKSQYLREVHGDCYGVVMATGTPISNSITECYTFTRMLRPDMLEEAGIQNFNDWMGLYGEIKHGMEMKPEGGGYQMKSRLSRFKNIPELVKMIRTFIDFKTREDLNLPSPNIIEKQVAAPQSEFMQGFMKYIEARAKTVRAKSEEGPTGPAEVIANDIRNALYKANDSTIIDEETGEVNEDLITPLKKDFLFSIIAEARKAALHTRLVHPKFKDDNKDTKVNLCVQTLLDIYKRFDEQKGAQMIFCDYSSPTGKGIFNAYDDIRNKLIAAGIPEKEIAFIHNAKKDSDKEELFGKIRSGEVRFILGSTQKMGVGTNVQERLVALHELDPPWKPADCEQRRGRMDRQGNSFDEAYSYRYVTVDSFDLFMWETLNRKLKMINQAMRRPEDCARELDEEVEPGYEDIMATTTGNPKIKEFMAVRQQLDKLKRMQDSHTDQQADLGSRVLIQERKLESQNDYLQLKLDEQKTVTENTPLALLIDKEVPGMCSGPMAVTGGLKNLGAAIEAMADQCQRYRTTTIGQFGGLNVKLARMGSTPSLIVERMDGREETIYTISSDLDAVGRMQQGALSDELEPETDEYYDAAKTLVRYVRKIGQDNGIKKTKEAISTTESNLARLKEDLGAPFTYEDEIKDARTRHANLSEEIGDAIDEDKQLDPWPLVRFIEMMNESTDGSFQQLLSNSRRLAERYHENPSEKPPSNKDENALDELLDTDDGPDDDDDDDDLSQHIA